MFLHKRILRNRTIHVQNDLDVRTLTEVCSRGSALHGTLELGGVLRAWRFVYAGAEESGSLKRLCLARREKKPSGEPPLLLASRVLPRRSNGTALFRYERATMLCLGRARRGAVSAARRSAFSSDRTRGDDSQQRFSP
ncbi:hypothetical protein SKAU_G00326940 [Synaphobranchus kaupii]|uniref:Uncharacterized protein n=1 Tax=Synaphobranchus kaupii TaxID=118154 RepID=A0A9Q1IKC1_SYNKA|nr:hypothetical protein SKAU_G00326940 [Synaphobranchus kaupii]